MRLAEKVPDHSYKTVSLDGTTQKVPWYVDLGGVDGDSLTLPPSDWSDPCSSCTAPPPYESNVVDNS